MELPPIGAPCYFSVNAPFCTYQVSGGVTPHYLHFEKNGRIVVCSGHYAYFMRHIYANCAFCGCGMYENANVLCSACYAKHYTWTEPRRAYATACREIAEAVGTVPDSGAQRAARLLLTPYLGVGAAWYHLCAVQMHTPCNFDDVCAAIIANPAVYFTNYIHALSGSGSSPDETRERNGSIPPARCSTPT